MALKIRLARPKGKHPWIQLLLGVALLCVVVTGLTVFGFGGFYYIKYQSIVNARLKEPLFADTAKIYATPREVRPGQKLSLKLIASELRSAGYTTDGAGDAVAKVG